MKFLDVNIRKNCYSQETVRNSLEQADVLKLNAEETLFLKNYLDLRGEELYQLATEIMGRWNLSYCVVTLGEHGAFAVSSKGDKVYLPGYDIELVDPCGSGDAFSAGFIDCILREKALEEAVLYGNAMCALVATNKGATGLLSTVEINDFITNNRATLVEKSLQDFIA